MGLGDELMAAGEARRVQWSDPRPVRILDKHGRPRWHDLWEGNPRIARPDDQRDCQTIVNGSGARPYVARYVEDRWFYNLDYRPVPAELYGVRPVRMVENSILVEPHIKANASPCKQWGWDRWQALTSAIVRKGWNPVQIGPPATRKLEGVAFIQTPAFSDTFGVLKGVWAAVLPEGGLHHAAAALNSRAVVVFGAMPPPATAYPHLNNIIVDNPEALGWRVEHPAARAAMDSISVDRVMTELEICLAAG